MAASDTRYASKYRLRFKGRPQMESRQGFLGDLFAKAAPDLLKYRRLENASSQRWRPPVPPLS
jgi:hypothetical protein